MCETARQRYHTPLEDSAQWDGLRLRPGDVVISTPPKSGTTWMQMICALLVFRTADLPAALTALSPWVDTRLRPAQDIYRQLEAERHRRFMKTHTPLDGLPINRRVTYVVVGRDPRDAAISHYYQKLTLKRHHERIGARKPAGPSATPTVREALLEWMDSDESPQRNPRTLRGAVWHLSDAWSRRHELNVVLFHYSDLSRDLEAEMRRLAGRLGIAIPEQTWPDLVEAATFTRMRQRSDDLVPTEGLAMLTAEDSSVFFRSGSSGQWRQWFTDSDIARYERRVATLAPPDLAHWLHRG